MRVCEGATTFCFILVPCLLIRATRAAFTPSRTLAASVIRHQLVPNGGPSYTRTTSPPSTLSVYNGDEHDEEWLQRELAALKHAQQDDDASTRPKKTTTNTNNRAVGPGRAGGRTRRVKTNHDRPSSGIKTTNWWIQAGIPVLAIAILVKTLLGGGGHTASSVTSSPSVYYYKSSYYESRVYTGNGNMERTQTSRIESNVPSFMPDKTLLPQQSKETSPASSSSDAAMNQGKVDAALIKAQQAMFSDWY